MHLKIDDDDDEHIDIDYEDIIYVYNLLFTIKLLNSYRGTEPRTDTTVHM